MRVFVGVDPSAEVVAVLSEVVGGLDLPGSLTPPDNWHLTLRFIGEMDEVGLDRLLGELDQADLGGEFEVRLSGLGTFPHPRRATVAWLGVTRGVEALADLAATVDDAVDAIGHGLEDRPFVPHLTLARIRPPADLRSLVESSPVPDLDMAVTAVTVFCSHLSDGPARYERLERIGL